MSQDNSNQNENDSVEVLSTGALGVIGLMRRLTPYFGPDLWACAAIASMITAQALIGRGIIIVFGLAIDRGIIGKDASALLGLAGLYFAMETTNMFLQVRSAAWFADVGNRVLFRLREHLVRHVQSLPASYFDRVSSGRIVTRLTSDTVSLTELFGQGLLHVFSSVVTMATIIVAMSVISVKMTLCAMLVAPPLAIVTFILSKKILFAQRIAKKRVSAINAFVAESVAGIRVLQLFNETFGQKQRFDTLSEAYRQDNLKVVSLYALFYPTASLFTAVSVGISLVVGGEMTLAGGIITTGSMIAFIFHVKDFGDPLRSLLERYQLFQNSVSSGERIFALLEEPVETNAPGSLAELPTPAGGKLQGTLEFKDVRFRYKPELPWALDGVSFKLEAGKTLAVVGRTGSGKSTLISLLQRFRDTTEGEIYVDDIALSTIDRRAIRTTIGVVQQDVFLFRGTIAGNIGLDDPKISRERIAWAAKEAGLTRLVGMRPGGLDAVVEEKGANLSIGERQLVAFARILAFDCEIMVLDEATANVDSETEALLQAATSRARLNRTSIIIAHRLSTIMDADAVLVLQQGRVVQNGSPRDLLAADGLFKQLSQHI